MTALVTACRIRITQTLSVPCPPGPPASRIYLLGESGEGEFGPRAREAPGGGWQEERRFKFSHLRHSFLGKEHMGLVRSGSLIHSESLPGRSARRRGEEGREGQGGTCVGAGGMDGDPRSWLGDSAWKLGVWWGLTDDVAPSLRTLGCRHRVSRSLQCL